MGASLRLVGVCEQQAVQNSEPEQTTISISLLNSLAYHVRVIPRARGQHVADAASLSSEAVGKNPTLDPPACKAYASFWASLRSCGLDFCSSEKPDGLRIRIASIASWEVEQRISQHQLLLWHPYVQVA